MDWSAIFAGVAAVAAIAGFVYSVRQHQDNIRKEFLRWAIDELYTPDQRQARTLIFELARGRTKRATEFRDKLITGIKNSEEKALLSKEYNQLRAVFGLFDRIGYFWGRLKCGKKEDALALFPQIIEVWDVSEPFISAIRSHEIDAKSFEYFEKFVKRLKRSRK